MMKLLEKTHLSRSRQKIASTTVSGLLLGAVFTVEFLFGTGPSAAQGAANLNSYAGIWKMTAQGKRVGTLELVTYNRRLTDSITNGHATMDGNGKLEAIPGAAPIVRADISGGALIISTEEREHFDLGNDPDWTKTGLLKFAVKGHEMTPFQISQISWDENEEDAENSAE